MKRGVLLVRKRGATAFMRHGGKPGVGEIPIVARARESPQCDAAGGGGPKYKRHAAASCGLLPF